MTELLSEVFFLLESYLLCSGSYCYAYIFAFPLLLIFILKILRKSLLKSAKKKGNFDSLSWLQMEHAAKEFYKKKGYKVTIKGGSSPDGGIDLIAKKSNQNVLIQVKHYKSKVGVKVVREMLGVLIDNTDFNAVHIVSSSDFTKPAKELASRHKIILIGRRQLLS